MNRSIALAACFLVTAILPAPLGASEPLKTFVPTSQYQQTNLIGWTVLVNKALLAQQRSLGSNALALLAEKLREITNAVPERACFQLQQVRIWLGVNDGHAPCAEYHPSASW